MREDGIHELSAPVSQVWAGLPVGSVITSMFAKDLDAGENGTVRFSLETGTYI